MRNLVILFGIVNLTGASQRESSRVPTRLDENVDHITVLIDRAPQILALSVDRDEEFVQMPRVAESALTTLQAARVLDSEFHRPLSDRFIGHVDTALNEHFFDFPEAETESIVESNGVADDFRWKAMPRVAGSTGFHPDIVPCGELT